MANNQVQIRRDTASNLATSSVQEGEIAYNKTNERLHAGNGATAGGIPHLNYKDAISQTFTWLTVSGTDTLTATPSPASTSYGSGMAFEFIAANGNTGAVTMNINSIGAVNIYKIANGSLTALSAGDIIAGVIYRIIFDGTRFQLINPSAASSGSFASYTPTFTGFGTPTSVSFGYQKTGGILTILGSFVSGVVSATEARISLPSGLTSSALLPSSIIHCGTMLPDGVYSYDRHPLIEQSTAYMTFGIGNGSNAPLAKSNASTIFVNGQRYSLNAVIPV